jgi:hypothetical protein
VVVAHARCEDGRCVSVSLDNVLDIPISISVVIDT